MTGATPGVIPRRLIVQSWRSINFAARHPDSTRILSFIPENGHRRLDLLHLDVPELDFRGVTEGWEKFCWTPWRRHRAATARA